MTKVIFFRNNFDLIQKANKALSELIESKCIIEKGKEMINFINALGYKNVDFVIINDDCNGAIVVFK